MEFVTTMDFSPALIFESIKYGIGIPEISFYKLH